MLCTFCGTENRPENKFCGMCGVRLERRKAERRARQDGLKCPACGHSNDLGQKFCGMCGSRVDRRVVDRRAAAPNEPRATAMANAQLPPPEAPGRAAELGPMVAVVDQPKEAQPSPVSEILPHPKPQPAIFRNEPPRAAGVSGPSFLGLGDEPENPGEYLLDDEASSGSMLRRLVLIAILAAIAGLVFVGWRSSSRANPKPASPPPTQASPSPQSKGPDSGSDTPSAKASDASPAAASEAKDEPLADGKTAPAASTVPGGADKSAESGKDESSSTSRKTSRESTEATPPGQRRPSALLLLAQQYLQGRGGVKQNCEQGLTYLKAAAQKNEPAAAVQMGALYASGHCVQRDEVSAYRWFNSAHELDPANPWIQTNLDQLWAEMTPQQRRQVGQ
jgi:hypothetical protein